jgi:hypothetical protein
MNPAHFEILKKFQPNLYKSRVCHTLSMFDDINIEQYVCFSSKRSRLYKEFISLLDFHNIPYEIKEWYEDIGKTIFIDLKNQL